jgi:hypothetical protein
MSAPGRPKRELRPLGGQLSGESRKRGGRPMYGVAADQGKTEKW